MIAALRNVTVLVRWDDAAVGLTGWGWVALILVTSSIEHIGNWRRG